MGPQADFSKKTEQCPGSDGFTLRHIRLARLERRWTDRLDLTGGNVVSTRSLGHTCPPGRMPQPLRGKRAWGLSARIHLVCHEPLRGDGLDVLQGLLHQVAHHSVHAAGLFVDGNLAISTSAARVVQQAAQVVDLTAAA